MRDEIRRLLRQEPFRPFRIFVSDGAEYEIRNPQSTAVDQSTVSIVYPVLSAADSAIERIVRIALIHVARVEQIIPTE